MHRRHAFLEDMRKEMYEMHVCVKDRICVKGQCTRKICAYESMPSVKAWRP